MFEAIDLRKCDFSDTIPQIFSPWSVLPESEN